MMRLLPKLPPAFGKMLQMAVLSQGTLKPTRLFDIPLGWVSLGKVQPECLRFALFAHKFWQHREKVTNY